MVFQPSIHQLFQVPVKEMQAVADSTSIFGMPRREGLADALGAFPFRGSWTRELVVRTLPGVLRREVKRTMKIPHHLLYIVLYVLYSAVLYGSAPSPAMLPLAVGCGQIQCLN